MNRRKSRKKSGVNHESDQYQTAAYRLIARRSESGRPEFTSGGTAEVYDEWRDGK